MIRIVNTLCFVALALLSAFLVSAGPDTNKSTSRQIKIMNSSDARIEVYWVNVSKIP